MSSAKTEVFSTTIKKDKMLENNKKINEKTCASGTDIDEDGAIIQKQRKNVKVSKAKVGPRPGSITLKMLINAGLIDAGQEVLVVEYKGTITKVDLTPEGTMVVNLDNGQSKEFDSPSACAVFVKRLYTPTRKADDGWKSLKYEGKAIEYYKKLLNPCQVNEYLSDNTSADINNVVDDISTAQNSKLQALERRQRRENRMIAKATSNFNLPPNPYPQRPVHPPMQPYPYPQPQGQPYILPQPQLQLHPQPQPQLHPQSNTEPTVLNPVPVPSAKRQKINGTSTNSTQQFLFEQIGLQDYKKKGENVQQQQNQQLQEQESELGPQQIERKELQLKQKLVQDADKSVQKLSVRVQQSSQNQNFDESFKKNENELKNVNDLKRSSIEQNCQVSNMEIDVEQDQIQEAIKKGRNDQNQEAVKIEREDEKPFFQQSNNKDINNKQQMEMENITSNKSRKSKRKSAQECEEEYSSSQEDSQGYQVSQYLQLQQQQQQGNEDASNVNRPKRQLRSRSGPLNNVRADRNHSMVPCEPYAGGKSQQPFRVHVAPCVEMLMDFHAHLSYSEIIGLLGGTWDETNRCITIAKAVPVKAVKTDDDSINAEMDPVEQQIVTEELQSQGLTTVGWYHSHPAFEASPSLIDIREQLTQQKWHRTPSGDQPYVAVIVGPHLRNSSNITSDITYFWVECDPSINLGKQDDFLENGCVPMLLQIDALKDRMVEPKTVLKNMSLLHLEYNGVDNSTNLKGLWRDRFSMLYKLMKSTGSRLPNLWDNKQKEEFMGGLKSLIETDTLQGFL